MKTKTKISFGAATLFLAGLFYFMPLSAQESVEDSIGETKTFTDCWGSGDFSMSCTNGTAKVIGCQPDAGSFCVGVR